MEDYMLHSLRSSKSLQLKCLQMRGEERQTEGVVRGENDGSLLSVNWAIDCPLSGIYDCSFFWSFEQHASLCVCMCVRSFRFICVPGESTSVSNKSDLFPGTLERECMAAYWYYKREDWKQVFASSLSHLYKRHSRTQTKVAELPQSNLVRAGFAVLRDCVAVKTHCWPGIEISPGLSRLSTSCSVSFHPFALHISFF